MGNSADVKTPRNTMQPKHTAVQNYLVVWVNDKILPDNQSYKTKVAQLRRIVKLVICCPTLVKCVEFLNQVHDEKVFVILSTISEENVIAAVHHMSCVDSIYILDKKKMQDESEWIKQWPKIRGVFAEVESVYEPLKELTYDYDHNAIPMSFISKSKMDLITPHKTDLTQLPASFLYSVLLGEIILETQHDDSKSIHKLVIYCKERGIPDDELTDFQKTYQHKKSLTWYNSEKFLYGMLNRALRTLDMEVMSNLIFFVRDLHYQLHQLYNHQAKSLEKLLTVYRGQGLTSEDFQQLIDAKNGFISFNNFLSTTTERDIALVFVKKALKQITKVPVLFIISIHAIQSMAKTNPYAFTSTCSAIPPEKEILFSIHTTFHVGDIRRFPTSNRAWEVELTLLNENDSRLNMIIHSIRTDIQGSDGWFRMSKLMVAAGHFEQAEQLYNQLLEKSTKDGERVFIYQQLARVARRQEHHEKRALLGEKCLQSCEKSLSKDPSSLVLLYGDIAAAHYKVGNYSKSLDFYEKVHRIKEKSLPRNHPELATSYNNIGAVYNDIGEYSKALDNYEKALQIKEESLPVFHASLAISYNNIGTIHNDMGNYSKALEYYQKSLEIYNKTLSPNHSLLATCYNNIGSVYYDLGDYKAAMKALKHAFEIRQRISSTKTSAQAFTYSWIGKISCGMKEYPRAVEYLTKCLEIFQTSLPDTHSYIAATYGALGTVHLRMGDFDQALCYHLKACSIQESTGCNPLERATTYNNLGETFRGLNEYTEASKYFEQALQIREKQLPANHPHLLSLYHNIAGVFMAGRGYSTNVKAIQQG